MRIICWPLNSLSILASFCQSRDEYYLSLQYEIAAIQHDCARRGVFGTVPPRSRPLRARQPREPTAGCARAASCRATRRGRLRRKPFFPAPDDGLGLSGSPHDFGGAVASAVSKTILARQTCFCGLFRWATIVFSSARSAADLARAPVWLPIEPAPPYSRGACGLPSCRIESPNRKLAPRQRSPFIPVHGGKLPGHVGKDGRELLRPRQGRLQRTLLPGQKLRDQRRRSQTRT
jgi:hypothetical protein